MCVWMERLMYGSTLNDGREIWETAKRRSGWTRGGVWRGGFLGRTLLQPDCRTGMSWGHGVMGSWVRTGLANQQVCVET